MDYNEVVAKLTIQVVAILAARGISAAYSDVYNWLYAQGVHHEDDARTLADRWTG
jgi:hypothetical protein